MPLNVIVDRNGGVDVHVAVKSNEHDKVDDYYQARKDGTTQTCSSASLCFAGKPGATGGFRH